MTESNQHSELVETLRRALERGHNFDKGVPGYRPQSRDVWDEANVALDSLEEQLQSAHRNMDRYGMALAEIAALPENGLGGTGAAPRIALEALHGSNPASEPETVTIDSPIGPLKGRRYPLPDSD